MHRNPCIIRGKTESNGKEANERMCVKEEEGRMRIRDENRYVDTSQSSFRRRYRTPRFLNFRSLILVGLFAPMLAGWAIIITNQINGTYFKEKYPKCNKTNAFDDAKKHFGHGKCYGGALNSLECDFEQSDCVMFNIAYPL